MMLIKIHNDKRCSNNIPTIFIRNDVGLIRIEKMKYAPESELRYTIETRKGDIENDYNRDILPDEFIPFVESIWSRVKGNGYKGKIVGMDVVGPLMDALIENGTERIIDVVGMIL